MVDTVEQNETGETDEDESELEYVEPRGLPARRADGSVIEPGPRRLRFKAPYPLYGFGRIEGRLNDHVPPDFRPRPVARPETLVLDFNSLDRRMPQFLPGEVFEEIYGAAARRDFADTELVRGQDDSFRPRDRQAFARAPCADMTMMVTDGGNHFWMRPEGHDQTLAHWCDLYGANNIRLRDGSGHFHTHDRFNEIHRTQYKPRPAFDAFAAFTGRSARRDIPSILVREGPDTFVGAARFLREAAAAAPAQPGARRAHLSAALAGRAFWILTPTGDDYFCPSSANLTNRAYLERVLTGHGLDPAALRAARPTPDTAPPSFMVRMDAETFLSGRAAAAQAAAVGKTLLQAHVREDFFLLRPNTRARGGNFSAPDHFRNVALADMGREAVALLNLRANERGMVDFPLTAPLTAQAAHTEAARTETTRSAGPLRGLQPRPNGGDRGR